MSTQILIVLSAILIAGVLVVQATSKDDIVYPVAELAGCKDEIGCRAYCERPANIKVCVAFAEKHNLMSQEEVEIAKKFIAIGAKGPGGCTGKDSCEKYCNDISHIDECVKFADNEGIISKDKLDEAKKIQVALAKGAKLPGGCKNKNECEAYCQNPDRMEECINFAEAAGFIEPDELADAKKMLEAVKRGVKAPPCRGKKECDVYCTQPENFEQCINFAEAAGFIPPEELEDAKKALVAIKKGIKPPPCRSKKQCESYCTEPQNLESCMTFAEAAGFISQEEAALARKTGGKGPGGCKGKEECEAFCKEEANQEACFSFAEKHDLLTGEHMKELEDGKKQIQEALSNVPPLVLDCLQSAIGSEKLEKLKAGTGMPSHKIGETMRGCFEKAFEGGGPPGGVRPEGEGGGAIQHRDDNGSFPRREDGSDGGAQHPGGESGGRGLGSLDNIPPPVATCLRSAIGNELFEGIKIGQKVLPPDFQEKLNSCIQESIHSGTPQGAPGGGFPGGAPTGGGVIPQLPPEGFHPPEGSLPGSFPSSGTFHPPSDTSIPPSSTPPPPSTISPPSSTEPPPSSPLPPSSRLKALIDQFAALLRFLVR